MKRLRIAGKRCGRCFATILPAASVIGMPTDVMMFACVLASVLLLPWWATVFVTAAMIAIRNIAKDQYGGMQICMLVLPGAMLGIIELGRLIRDAETQGASLAIGPILMVTVVPLVGFVASLLVLMAAVLGMMLGWEWAMGRFNAWAERNKGQK